MAVCMQSRPTVEFLIMGSCCVEEVPRSNNSLRKSCYLRGGLLLSDKTSVDIVNVIMISPFLLVITPVPILEFEDRPDSLVMMTEALLL